MICVWQGPYLLRVREWRVRANTFTGVDGVTRHQVLRAHVEAETVLAHVGQRVLSMQERWHDQTQDTVQCHATHVAKKGHSHRAALRTIYGHLDWSSGVSAEIWTWD